MKTSIFLTLLCSGWCSALFAQLPSTATIAPETVVAKVDGKDVTAAEIQQALTTLPPQFAQLFSQNPKAAVQQMFVMRYLAEEGEKLNLAEQSPLKEQLQMQRANAVAGARLNYESDHYQVPQDAIDEYYKRNQTKYQQARIKVISIAFKPTLAGSGTAPQAASLDDVAKQALAAAHSPEQRSEAEARQRAEEVVQKLKGGEDFAKLVAEYSDDATSKAAGGDFPAVKFSSSYPDEVKKAVFALASGQVSGPLRQVSAFYIIRVQDKSTQPISEVVGPISQEIRQAHVTEWFQNLTKRFDPTVESVEFFAQPSKALPPQPAPKPPGR
jgi:parvulin-like peptidyl-prolyl isomerase